MKLILTSDVLGLGAPGDVVEVADLHEAWGVPAGTTTPASAVAAGKKHIPTLDQAGAEASALATLEATIPLWTAPAPIRKRSSRCIANTAPQSTVGVFAKPVMPRPPPRSM